MLETFQLFFFCIPVGAIESCMRKRKKSRVGEIGGEYDVSSCHCTLHPIQDTKKHTITTDDKGKEIGAYIQ